MSAGKLAEGDELVAHPAGLPVLPLRGRLKSFLQGVRTLSGGLLVPRLLIASCQAATILINKRLFEARDFPPPLPVADWLPQVSMVIPLLVSVSLLVIFPRLGLFVHWTFLGYALISDQTRMQPPVISIALLLAGTIPWPLGRVIAATHLVTQLFWAGLHKLLSSEYMEQTAQIFYNTLPFSNEFLRQHLGWMLAGSEILLSLLLLIRPLRRLGVLLLIALHAGILIEMSPLGLGWNLTITPWNIALPIAAFVFFWNLSSFLPSNLLSQRKVTVVMLALALFPLGFYLGVVDAYVSHNLFTDNLPNAFRCDITCTRFVDSDIIEEFRTVIPARRLHKMYFAQTCRPGETLSIHPRRVRILFGFNTDSVTYSCSELRGTQDD